MTKKQLKKLLTLLDDYKELKYSLAEEENCTAFLSGEVEELDNLEDTLLKEIKMAK